MNTINTSIDSNIMRIGATGQSRTSPPPSLDLAARPPTMTIFYMFHPNQIKSTVGNIGTGPSHNIKDYVCY
jgi:hypothetical protein